MILSAALAITNAVLFIVCRACSGCWDWLEPVPTGPSRGSPKPFFGSERQPLQYRSAWGGVGNAAQREPCVGHVEARSVLRCRAESGQPKITRDPGLLLVQVHLRFPNVYARPMRVRRAS